MNNSKIYQTMSKWFANLEDDDRSLVIEADIDEIKKSDEDFMDDMTGVQWSTLDTDVKTQIIKWYHGLRKGLSEPKIGASFTVEELDMAKYFKDEAVKVDSDPYIPVISKVSKPKQPTHDTNKIESYIKELAQPTKKAVGRPSKVVVKTAMGVERVDVARFDTLLKCTLAATKQMCKFLIGQSKPDECDEASINTVWTKLYALRQTIESDGTYQMTYTPSKIARSHTGVGRMFACSTSLQSIHRPLRQYLSQTLTVDVDISNSHPSIIKGICSSLGVECDELTEYINLREEYLADVAKELKVDRSGAKQAVLSAINGGSRPSAKLTALNEKLNKVANDEKISKLCQKYKVQCESAKSAYAPLPRRMLIALVNEVEADILADAVAYMNSVLCSESHDGDLQCGSYIFDGFHMHLKAGGSLELCAATEWVQSKMESLNEYISQKYGFALKFEVKPMTDALTLSEADYDAPETGYIHTLGLALKCNIDMSDPYCWNDFKTKYSRKSYANETEAINDMRNDLNRVMTNIQSDGGYYLLKIDHNAQLEQLNLTSLRNSTNNIKIKIGSTRETLVNLLSYPDLLYSYIKCDYYPDPAKCPKHVMNMWPKFAFDLVPRDMVDMNLVDGILTIIKLWANGDDKLFKWLLHWIYKGIVDPSNKVRTAIVAYSDGEGTGKGTLCDFLADFVFGAVLSTKYNTLAKLTDKHSHKDQNKKFVFVAELPKEPSKIDEHDASMKSMITDPTLDINPKGERIITGMKSYGNFIFMTNHKTSLKLNNTNRRYQCLTISAEKISDPNFWIHWRATYYNQDVANHFCTWLMDYDFTYADGKPVNSSVIIETELSLEMKEDSKPNSVLFLDDFIKDPNSPLIIGGLELYSKYKIWCEARGEFVVSNRYFAPFAKKQLVFEHGRLNNTYTRPV